MYEAERVDDFTQTVAVKLLLDAGPEAVRRFQAEKESLAALPHPGIVQLINAGLNDAGIPYLAMQYVDGQTLDRYCAEVKPSLDARLRMMVQILEAIEFAHRRLIAHCDLKSSNVLVTADGTPHLLDFGIAKLLNPKQLGAAGPVTQNFRPLTPEFASPEQLNGQPLGTATDIYSAGVLLYGLLTGKHPFEEVVVRPVELLEAVCLHQPEPPSRRDATIDPDLDAITLKALRKEPDERYRSAQEFAADIERFRSGLPVEARQGSTMYQASKFIRRNRGVAAAIAVMLLAIAAGAGGTAWESYRARQARQRAEARFADVRKLSNSLLTGFYAKVSKLPGATNAQKILVTQSIQYLDRLAGGSPTGALALELAEGYLKMGILQGSPYEANLGQPAEALATIDKARGFAGKQANGQPADTRANSILAQAALARADVLAGMGRLRESMIDVQAAVATGDRLAAAQPGDLEAVVLAASCHESLGDKLGTVGAGSMLDQRGARVQYERALELFRQALLIDPSSARPARAIAILSMKLGDQTARNDLAAAAEQYLEANRILNNLPAKLREELPNRRLAASIARRLGETYADLGVRDKARGYLEEAVKSSESILSIDPSNAGAHWDASVGLHALADLEEAQHHPREALAYAERISALLQKMPSLAESLTLETSYAQTLVQIGRLRLALGENASAKVSAEKGLALARTVAATPEASIQDLGRIAEMFLTVEPANLQNPMFALECLDRALRSAAEGSADPQMLRLAAEAELRLGRRAASHQRALQGLTALGQSTTGESARALRQRLDQLVAQTR